MFEMLSNRPVFLGVTGVLQRTVVRRRRRVINLKSWGGEGGGRGFGNFVRK